MNKDTLVAFASAARTASANSDPLDTLGARGIHATLDITAAGGTTPTLDVKFQALDQVSGKWSDITGASFAQKTAASTDTLQVYPGIAEVANREVSRAICRRIRAVATIAGGGGETFTFSLALEVLP